MAVHRNCTKRAGGLHIFVSLYIQLHIIYLYVCMYICMYGWMDGWMDVYTHYTLKTDLAQRFMKYFALYRVLDSRGVKRGPTDLEYEALHTCCNWTWR